MPTSNAGQRDPSALGKTKYERAPLDFYPTPRKVTEALVEVLADDLPSFLIWEPFCGNGAISKVLAEYDPRDVLSTDIKEYEGFDADALIDFFEVKSLEELRPILGQTPDVIITNPPYGKTAKQFIQHALELLEPQKGFLAVLMRHEWDASRGNAKLCEHPAFAMKLSIKFRPVWIEPVEGEKKVSPRFPYAWYVWDFTRVTPDGQALPAECRYVG